MGCYERNLGSAVGLSRALKAGAGALTSVSVQPATKGDRMIGSMKQWIERAFQACRSMFGRSKQGPRAS
jgi:hypothetical protein